MSALARSLLRCAVEACERGDAGRAGSLVREALDRLDAPEPLPAAESYADFARRVGKSPRVVRAMVADGRIPSLAVVGSGRGRRVLVREALDALRDPTRSMSDAERAGAAHVERRRARLRVVGAS